MDNNKINDEKAFSIPGNANAHPENINDVSVEEENEILKSFEKKAKKNSFKFRFNKFIQSTRYLSIVLASLMLLFSIVVSYPISQVFNGSYKLNQQVNILSIEEVKIGSKDWIVGDGFSLYFESPGFNFSLRYYAICIFLGLMAGYILALYLAKKSHIASTIIDRLLIGLIVFGLIGARLFFVAFNWDLFSQDIQSIIFGLPQGGLSFFGAFLGSMFYLILYVYKYRFNLWEFLDVLAPAVLAGQILGRWGNFFNYEAYGPTTSLYWKMFVPASVNLGDDINNSFFHPTFLYEIIPNAILLILILFFYKKLTFRKSGLAFAFYAMGYGIIRFFTEFFRLDALKLDLGFEFNVWIYTIEYIYISQLMAIMLFFVGYFTYINRRKVLFIKKNLEEIKV